MENSLSNRNRVMALPSLLACPWKRRSFHNSHGIRAPASANSLTYTYSSQTKAHFPRSLAGQDPISGPCCYCRVTSTRIMPVPSETGSSGDAVILSHVPNRGSAAPGPARAPLHLFVILLTGKVLRDTFSSVFRIPLGLP